MAEPYKVKMVSDTSQVVGPMGRVADTFEAAAESLDRLGVSGARAGDDISDAATEVGRDADKMADSLHDAGKDIARDASKAAGQLEDEYSAGLKEIVREGKTTGDKLGKDLKDGTDLAGEGMEELKDESKSTAKEAAASFGSVEDALDAVQEIAANAFVGFGPAGLAAGLVAAAGIGLAFAAAQESAEKIAQAKDAAIDLAGQLADVDGNPALLEWADRLRQKLTAVVDDRDWWEFWQDEPKTAMEQWSKAADAFGLDFGQLARGMAGDSGDIETALDQVNGKIAAQEAQYESLIRAGMHPMTAAAQTNTGELEKLRDGLTAAADEMESAAQMAELLAVAEGSLEDTTRETAQSHDTYRAAVADALTGAGESWENYVQDGIVNLDAYNAAIEEQARAVEAFESNMATASGQLSQEAMNFIRSLGPQAAPLLQAFVDAPLDQQQRTARNWDTLGRAATDGYKESLDLTAETGAEIDAANRHAAANPVRPVMRLDDSDLQYQADRAAARIRPPVVHVRTVFDSKAV